MENDGKPKGRMRDETQSTPGDDASGGVGRGTGACISASGEGHPDGQCLVCLLGRDHDEVADRARSRPRFSYTDRRAAGAQPACPSGDVRAGSELDVCTDDDARLCGLSARLGREQEARENSRPKRRVAPGSAAKAVHCCHRQADYSARIAGLALGNRAEGSSPCAAFLRRCALPSAARVCGCTFASKLCRHRMFAFRVPNPRGDGGEGGQNRGHVPARRRTHPFPKGPRPSTWPAQPRWRWRARRCRAWSCWRTSR